MALYRIDCANLAEQHGHVTSVIARMWNDDGAEGGAWEVPEMLSRDAVIAMIETGDEFTTAQKGGGVVSVVHEPCSDDCPEVVLRTRADDSTTDDLDHIPCK